MSDSNLSDTRFDNALKVLPGIAAAVTVMLLALPTADWIGSWVLSFEGIDPSGRSSPISGVSVAILIGILARNLLPLRVGLKPGIQFSMTRLLRLGIILVGIKLSLGDLLRVGAWGFLAVIVPIGAGLAFVTWFNRLLRLPSRLGTLIAAGTSICGVTAILSTAPAIEAHDDEITYAIANITIFGLAGMLFYPYLAHWLIGTSAGVGLFLGTAVHDTSQVVGAAITYKEVFDDDRVLQATTLTKLVRNLFLAAVVPLLAFCHWRAAPDRAPRRSASFFDLFPLFVLGFISMALIRSIGDATVKNGLAYGIWDQGHWSWLTTQIGDMLGAKFLLGTAMSALGLGTDLSVFKGVGMRPFVVGLAGALFVGLVGFLMSWFLSPFVHI